MPRRRNVVWADISVARTREERVRLQRSLARRTWVIEARERLEERRWGRREARGGAGAGAGAVGLGGEGGGWTAEEEEAMVDEGGVVGHPCSVD